MKMRKILALTLATLAILTLNVRADIWTTDLDAALKQAEKKDKKLLVNFTGSDWCGWCIKLDEEVFSTPTFKKEAPKDFVLVKLDFPRKKEQSPEVKQRNQQAAQKYGVQGFPTIILLNANGEVIGKTGYQQGGAKAYMAHLRDILEKAGDYQDALEKLPSSKGPEKAKLLDRIVTFKSSNNMPVDPEMYREICELDPTNATGLKKKYEGVIVLADMEQELNAAMQRNDIGAAMQAIDDAVNNSKLTTEQKQQAMMTKASLYMQQQKPDDAIKVLKKVQKIGPKSAIGMQIPDIIKQVQAQKGQ